MSGAEWFVLCLCVVVSGAAGAAVAVQRVKCFLGQCPKVSTSTCDECDHLFCDYHLVNHPCPQPAERHTHAGEMERLLREFKEAGFMKRGWWAKLVALLAQLDAEKEGR